MQTIITDVEDFNVDIVYGCNLNLAEMPLGRLSVQQIELAMAFLHDFKRRIQDNNATSQELIDASNKLYTLIPQVLPDSYIPLVDTCKVYKSVLQLECTVPNLNEFRSQI